MGRPRIYSDEQIEQAKHLYVEFGPQEAARQTGISAAWITKKARAAGLSTVHKEHLREATETAAERWHLKQELIIDGIADVILDALRRTNEPHKDYVGQMGREVTYPKAPPAAFLSYATVVEKGIKTLAILANGGSATRTEQVNAYVATNDVERAALRAAIEQELARRGTPLIRERGDADAPVRTELAPEAVSGGSATPEAPVAETPKDEPPLPEHP